MFLHPMTTKTFAIKCLTVCCANAGPQKNSVPHRLQEWLLVWIWVVPLFWANIEAVSSFWILRCHPGPRVHQLHLKPSNSTEHKFHGYSTCVSFLKSPFNENLFWVLSNPLDIYWRLAKCRTNVALEVMAFRFKHQTTLKSVKYNLKDYGWQSNSNFNIFLVKSICKCWFHVDQK